MRIPPLSNVERQRLFRARHPGYFGRYKVSRQDVERFTAAVYATLVPPNPEPAQPVEETAKAGQMKNEG